MLEDIKKMYPDAWVELAEIDAVNGITLGYRFVFDDEEGFEVPCAGIFSRQGLLDHIKASVEKQRLVMKKLSELNTWEAAMKAVFPKMVLSESNDHHKVKKDMENLPYSFIYGLSVNGEEVLLSQECLDSLGVDIDELHDAAMNNVGEPEIIGLKDSLEDEESFDLISSLYPEAGDILHFVTNKQRQYGTAAILSAQGIQSLLKAYPNGCKLIANDIHSWVAFKDIAESDALDLVKNLLRQSSASEFMGNHILTLDKSGTISLT